MQIDHIALRATDPRALASWYEEWFGLRTENLLSSDVRPPIVFLLDAAGQRIEILPDSSPDRRSKVIRFPHLAFSTTDLTRELRRLRNAGVSVLENRSTSAGWRIAYLTDPDGNLLELVQRQPRQSENREAFT